MIKKPNGEQAVGTREFRCLQLFRGLAALFVLLFHVDVISNLRFSTRFAGGHFSAGHLGVDFFFVLSGFIIWHVHAKDMGFAGRASSYLLKRVLRIWPLVLLLTTAKLGYMFFLGGAGVGAGKGSAEVVICSYFLLPVTESLGGKPLLDSAWTLPYEMLFYLAFAVGILFGKRVFIVGNFLWVGVILLCSLFPEKSFSEMIQFLFNPRTLQFLIGCLAAKFSEKGPCPIWGGLALGLGAGLLAYGLLASYALLTSLLAILFWGGVFGMIIFGAVVLEVGQKIKLPRAATVMGDASYSIYLVHSSVQVPVMLVLGKFVTPSDPSWQIHLWLVAVISLAAGFGVYRLIEKPITVLTKRLIGENLRPLAVP